MFKHAPSVPRVIMLIEGVLGEEGLDVRYEAAHRLSGCVVNQDGFREGSQNVGGTITYGLNF